MKNEPMPMGLAVFLLVLGILLGTVFTFGMQYWNKEVTRRDCNEIQTQFLDYEERYSRSGVKEIAIDCANGEKYYIAGVCINTELRNTLAKLTDNQNITLLIHPNSNTVVEFATETKTLLLFDTTITKLGIERTGFLFPGFFMYFCALTGMYHIILNTRKHRKRKR